MANMSDRTSGLFYIAAMLLLSLAFQYQMKLLATDVGPVLSRAGDLGVKLQGMLQGSVVWRLVLVLVLAAILFVIWLLALTKLELSVALPLASVALVVNTVGAGLLLGEALGMLRVAGTLTVAVGIAMVLKS
jgi:drug/metabolite transporter (DMT)-like permease